MDDDQIFQTLDLWNCWHRQINAGIQRPYYIEKIFPLLSRKEVLVLKGIRRCGKSTIMKQIMLKLLDQGVDKNSLLYLNLEDYGFRDSLNVDLFEQILNVYKKRLQPKGKVYFFIDEIQLVPEWERYIRTKYDLEENIKFVVSGSNASLLSKELSTKLTGRNITLEVRTLHYSEYKNFKKNSSLQDFITYGGFPEVVLEEDIAKKKILLQQYFEDLINKEILARYKIRNSEAVFNLARYLVQNSGTKQSMNKLSKALGVDNGTVNEYLSYMLDSYLIIKVPFFSFSIKKRFNKLTQPKYYSYDNGFMQITNLQYTEDKGKQFENLVLLEIMKSTKDVSYWQEKGEVDFVYDKEAVNVTIAGRNLPKREIEGLLEFSNKFKDFNMQIVTLEKHSKKEEVNVHSFEEFLN